MTVVENGKFVSVHYTGKLDNGEVFDSSIGRDPLEVPMGKGQMIPGFEKALLGMTANEKKTFTLSPDEAYGDRNNDFVRSFEKKDLSPELKPEVGKMVTLYGEQGQTIPAKITIVDEESITVDMNHPLAGESLTFDIEVVSINDTAQAPQEGCGSGCDCSKGCGC